MNAEVEFLVRVDREAKALNLPAYTELRDIAADALLTTAANGANHDTGHPYRALWARARRAFFPSKG